MMSSHERQSFNLPIFWHKKPWTTMYKKSRWGNRICLILFQFFLDLHPSKNLSTLKDNIFIHMCINKNLAYGMCSISCSYIKLSLSAGENANSLMLQCNSNCVYLFLIKCITCPMQWTPVFQWFQQIPGILDTTVTINSKSGTLYTP